MKIECVINEIEKIINYECDELDFEKIGVSYSSREVYLLSVAIRLVNTHKRFTAGQCGMADYLVALRGFMLSYQKSVRFDRAGEFSDLEKYGIYCDFYNGKYYAVYDTPQYVPNKSFISDAFVDINTNIPEQKSKYNLKTNSFIEQITGLNILNH